MELVNETGMDAGYTTALRTDGRALLVVAIKGTFAFPDRPDAEPALAAEPVPLVDTDEFTGEPGVSAPLREIDYAPRKPRCDVLLIGTAYAPRGRAVERVPVALRVGPWRKGFDVVGMRTWKPGVLFVAPSAIEPFATMPISYDTAFGGVDRTRDDPAKHRYYPTNHVGVGYHDNRDGRQVAGRPLPNTEETGRPVVEPWGTYKPMAFGPIARAWQPRVPLAGTYDDAWLAHRCPFLPRDFDDRYYQAAPEDQQIDYPRGGEEVELVNLTPAGRTVFRLPRRDVALTVHTRDGATRPEAVVRDTLVIEPDAKRFSLTWRATIPLQRNIHEIRRVVATVVGPGATA